MKAISAVPFTPPTTTCKHFLQMAFASSYCVRGKFTWKWWTHCLDFKSCGACLQKPFKGNISFKWLLQNLPAFNSADLRELHHQKEGRKDLLGREIPPPFILLVLGSLHFPSLCPWKCDHEGKLCRGRQWQPHQLLTSAPCLRCHKLIATWQHFAHTRLLKQAPESHLQQSHPLNFLYVHIMHLWYISLHKRITNITRKISEKTHPPFSFLSSPVLNSSLALENIT